MGFLTRSGGRGEPSRAPASRGGRRQRDGGAGYPPRRGTRRGREERGTAGGGVPAGPSPPAEPPPSRRARAVCAGPQRQPVRAAGQGTARRGAARLGRLLVLGQLESCRRQCGRSVCPPPDQRSAPGDSAAAVGWTLRGRRLQGPTKWGRGWRGGGRAQAWRRAALGGLRGERRGLPPQPGRPTAPAGGAGGVRGPAAGQRAEPSSWEVEFTAR